MGAMAPPPNWIPEDDVLLKQAVEAGASLESLAKGAVQFSRRYTVHELQDRWVSILYDPVVSEEASVHMFELERSGVINQLRPNKSEGVKDVACSSVKRRAESVRKHYYAMRKRICIEPLYMMDTNLAPGPGYSNFRDGNEFSSADWKVGNSASTVLGAQGPGYGIRHHPSSEFRPHAAESTGNGLTPAFSGVQNHGQEDLGAENVSNDLPYRYEENNSLTGDCSEIRGFVHSEDLPPCSLFEAEGLVNQASACTEFGDQSFRSFGCSPPLPHMPTTNNSHDISAAELLNEIADADLQLSDAFLVPQTANESDALGYGDGPSNLEFETPLSRDGTIDLTSRTQDYLEELFDLSNDEGLLYMDNDGKEDIGKSYLDGLSSLLLDSSSQCDLSGSGLDEAAVVADGHLVYRSDIRDGGSYNEDLSDQQEVADVQVSASEVTLKVGPEYCNGVIWCTLNTKDPDIPSNDDVFLPYRFPSLTDSSGSHWALHDLSYLGSSSVKNFSSTSNANGGHVVMKNTHTYSSVPSGRMGQFHPSDAGLRCRKDHRVKFELPESSVQHAAPREAWNSDNPHNVSLASVNASNVITGVKGGPTEMGQGRNIGHTPLNPRRDEHESNLDIRQNLRKSSVGCRSGVDCIAEISNNGSSNVGMSFQYTDVPKEIDHSLLSDHEELFSENESGVPYFSDVEAMILGMDLDPDDFDLYTNPEVQRYQLEETKRTIIRLEQSAESFRQRAITAQGAFAVLYGRFSRHLIKKPKVLLGRATDDIKVDIDLGMEKNGGKISRRQATMKMDMYGAFHLTNLGRTPVYVNGKEVSPGQSLGLISGCLVEVRGLSFVFETNRKAIKQYMDIALQERGV
ncbi:uncharacterized protein LOC121786385 isoform X1 [Salvia splendens]|uniref:uncharacterized protein LOC121786385 isoform X1 n=2 Tax=Salvia splendens TaxID=180675 RepID=UPI001C277394|nr:uncharacterized protein LOC121786385 isoform X1 [Salvia splendens]